MRDWDAVEGLERDAVAWEALALLTSGQLRDVGVALSELAEVRTRAVDATEIDVVDLVEAALRRRRGDDLEGLLAPLDTVVQRATRTGDRLLEGVARAQRTAVLCAAGDVGQAVAEIARARATLPALPPGALLGQRLYLMALGSMAHANQMLGLDDEAAALRAAATALDGRTAQAVPRDVDHGFAGVNEALAQLRVLLTGRTYGEPVRPELLKRVAEQLEVLRHDPRLVDGAAVSVEVVTWVVDAYSCASKEALRGLATIEWSDVRVPSLVRRVAVAALLHGLSRVGDVPGEDLRRARWLHEQLPSDDHLRSLDLAISAERLALETAVRARGEPDLVEDVIALRERQYAKVLRQLRLALSAAVRARCQWESLIVENSRLINDARSDALTGAGSRQYLQELMTNLIDAVPRSTGLVIVDIDRFKAINDTFGHPVGDAVLRRASAVISDCLRRGDHVFRYGGDEFVVLLTLTTPEATAACAERIRTAIEGYAWTQIAPGLEVTVSVGSEAARDSGEELLRSADEHLLRAKGYI